MRDDFYLTAIPLFSFLIQNLQWKCKLFIQCMRMFTNVVITRYTFWQPTVCDSNHFYITECRTLTWAANKVGSWHSAFSEQGAAYFQSSHAVKPEQAISFIRLPLCGPRTPLINKCRWMTWNPGVDVGALNLYIPCLNNDDLFPQICLTYE